MQVLRRSQSGEKISVVVPIFNTVQYLGRCVESILRQSYLDIEIILIDDGSTDGSGKICDEYATGDNRVRVIHRDNEGLVSARKLGANEATANYITFVDSDDWIDVNMIEEMMKPLNSDPQIDLIVSGMVMEKGSSKIMRKGAIPAGIYTDEIRDHVVPRMMYQWETGEFGILGSVGGKVYRKVLFAKVIEGIDDRITYGEDDALVYALIPRCEKLCVLDGFFYHYYVHGDSMAATYGLDVFVKLSLLKEYFEIVFHDEGIWDDVKSGVHQIIWMFLKQAIASVYDMHIGYQFPFASFPSGAKIVLYGAGEVGKNYYYALKGSGHANIVAWVDQTANEKRKQGLPVDPVGILTRVEYEYLIICIEGKEMAEAIKADLIKRGIDKRKIIWMVPKYLMM